MPWVGDAHDGADRIKYHALYATHAPLASYLRGTLLIDSIPSKWLRSFNLVEKMTSRARVFCQTAL